MTPLALHLERDGDRLRWRVEHTGDAPVWAFLLVPSWSGGALSLDADAAWLEAEGDVLIARKVDAPVPEGRRTDPIQSGAVRLGPGEQREGSFPLAAEVEVGGPYARKRQRHRVTTVVLEVGWVPVRDGQPVEACQIHGEPFAYLATEAEPGGQRFVRSAPLRFAP